jgi:DNA-binding SARP family transcriptional activator
MGFDRRSREYSRTRGSNSRVNAGGRASTTAGILHVASAATLLAVAVGVPVAMVLAHALPPLDALARVFRNPRELAQLLSGPLAASTALRVVETVGWCAWAWFVSCICLEVGSNLRGVPTFRIPASRHAQSLVACLVGASLTLLPTARSAATLRLQPVQATSAHSTDLRHIFVSENRLHVRLDAGNGAPFAYARGDNRDDVGGTSITELVEAAAETYVVEPGDTLWAIAEGKLGDPLRWREIAALNMGRLQPDGRTLTDAHWIFPGWVLLLPASPPMASSPPPSARSTTTVPTQSFAPSSPAALPAESSNESGRSPADGHVSQTLADIVGSAAGNSHGASGLESGRSAPRLHSQHSQHSLHSQHSQHSQNFPVVPIGFGLLGAGVVALLERMRRAQQRHRGAGLRIVLPREDIAEIEHGLRAGADPEAEDLIELVQRVVTVGVRSAGERSSDGWTMPRILGARVRARAVELLIDASGGISPPPPPFESTSSGTTWMLERDPELLARVEREVERAGADPAMPALVTLGRDQYGLLLIDLERIGSISVFGADAEALCQAMALEMACSRWSDQVDIVLVGSASDTAGIEHISRAASVASVVQRLERRVRERKTLLDLVRRASNTESRVFEGGDVWDLCAVFCLPGSVANERAAVDELVQLAEDGRFGLAVVACADEDLESRLRVRADGGPLDVDGTALSEAEVAIAEYDNVPIWPQRVDERVVSGVSELLKTAGELEGMPGPADPPSEIEKIDLPSLGHSTPEPGADVRRDSKEFEVEVRILGDVGVFGAAKPFTRAWAMELVVYLALHPNGASTEQWSTALWPDKLMAPASLHSTASSARRSLGVSSTGDDHLPRSHGRLKLGPLMTSDWNRFVLLSRSSDPADWRGAIELIRGRPFEGLRASDWTLLEGIAANIESEVVDTATRYAEWCLSRRDAEGAEYAARKALLVSPYDERLYRVLMRAADLTGNPAGIESVMQELIRLVAEDVEPFDAVHPETVDLYRSLSRRSAPPGLRRR